MKTHHPETDRATISAADPAIGRPPLRADQTIALAQRAMDADAQPLARPRTRRTMFAGLAAAAAVVVAGAVVALTVTTGPAPAPVALEQVPGGIAAKCIAPEAPALADLADTLLRADVTGISDGIVSLTVTDTLSGEPVGAIEVAQGDGLVSDGGPLVFDPQGTYLLAIQDGVILSCGLSGPATAQLESLYADAARLAAG
ncbi:hypothetical protein [Microbacterium sp.]|uniref:hypothetical protein n=1 Tax=Microbacterium sp. TaxID=51671 RepID=UPI003F721FE2